MTTIPAYQEIIISTDVGPRGGCRYFAAVRYADRWDEQFELPRRSRDLFASALRYASAREVRVEEEGAPAFAREFVLHGGKYIEVRI